jgi:PadR family transcriptional regulator, regulatory protein AphA
MDSSPEQYNPLMRLTPTSYVVLGLVRWSPGITAYELEQAVGATVTHMWTIQRSQIYKEPGRLAEAGLLDAVEDNQGRLKTHYSIAEPGEAAFQEWLGADVDRPPEMRDLAILKVFFGAEPREIARAQVTLHETRLKSYELLRAAGALAPRGARLALDAAIAHEQTSILYWTALAK